MRRSRQPLVAIVAILTAVAWSRAPQPEPLEISAAYISYGDLDGSWKLALKDPGKAMLLSYKRIKDGEQPVVISQARLAALREVIEKTQFFDLRDHYGDMPVDGPERRMEIKQHGRVKKVTVFSVGQNLSKRESAEVDRAMRVWVAIRECFQDPDASP